MEKKLEDWQIEDAARLKRLFEAKATQSQLAFGLKYEIGTQGMVWQYLNAHRALNLDALFKFAQGLDVEAKSISPILWKKVETSLVGIKNTESVSPLTDEQKSWLMLLDKIKEEAREPWLRVGELLSRISEDRRQRDVGHDPERRVMPYKPLNFPPKKPGSKSDKKKTQR